MKCNQIKMSDTQASGLSSGERLTCKSPISEGSGGASNGTDGDDNGIIEQLGHDLMTSSYTEISFEVSDDETDFELNDEMEADATSPQEDVGLSQRLSGSLSLPQLSSTIVNWSQRTKASYETENLNISSNSSTSMYDNNKSCLSQLPGTISYDGPMVSFVAEDFEKKLKLSNSSPSIEGDARRCAQVELKILNNLENQAKLLSDSINSMLRHISESTHNITSLTVDCIATYENCLSKTCDVIDSNIKSMYQLMAKCEELNQSMKPINKLSDELKEVKRLLELFEKAVEYRM